MSDITDSLRRENYEIINIQKDLIYSLKNYGQSNCCKKQNKRINGLRISIFKSCKGHIYNSCIK